MVLFILIFVEPLILLYWIWLRCFDKMHNDEFELECKPLNVITFGPGLIDRISRMITITSGFYLEFFRNWEYWNKTTLSDFHWNIIIIGCCQWTYHTVDAEFVTWEFCNQMLLVCIPYSDHRQMTTFPCHL